MELRVFLPFGILLIVFNSIVNLLYHPPLDPLNILVIVTGVCFFLIGVMGEKILTFLERSVSILESKPYHVLFIIIFSSVVIRLLFLPERWINPDEGAHLYDAKFVLEGKIPFVDYGSRMPFYVYSLAAFLKVFGCGFIYGRLLPLFSSVGIGIIVFFIGQRLFNTKIALLASAIYLFSPLSILWSVVVKTELPATLLVSAGMLALLSYFKLEKRAYYLLFLAGVLFALAFYVRQSALMMLIASLIFVLYYYKDNVFGAAKTYGVILLGYLSVVLVIFAFFSGFMGFSDTWNSNLNPLDTVSTPLQKVSNLYGGEQPSSSRSEEFRLEDQPWHQSVKEWRRTLEINSLLIFGLILSITYWIYYYRKERNPFSEFKLSYIFVYGWFFSIFIFYLYYSMQRGFFNQYFGEALPPLALITSHVIYSLTTNKEFRKKFNVLVLIILFSFFVSSFDYVISFDGVDSSFSCVWSPQTIGETTSYLKGSNKDAEVMSGAVIWEFESDTKPFLNITHPLSFRSGMNDKQVKEVKDRMFTDPPEYIILDGYTEQTYIRQVPAIKSVMNNSYVLKKEVSGSKYPVKIYELVK